MSENRATAGNGFLCNVGRKWYAIVQQFADDPELATILGQFVDSLEGQVDAMPQAYADGRQEEFQRAHRLKGAGGS